MARDRSDETRDRITALADKILGLVNGDEYATAATAISLAHICLVCASPAVTTITEAQDALRGFPAAAEDMVRSVFARVKASTRCIAIEADSADEARAIALRHADRKPRQGETWQSWQERTNA